ncbi:MAG: PD-(D/E)XK nuclease family protein [Candidatus Thermoplasmatota archaeon]|nr:PD-(D/E)XK nuclease family protein [Candidatus Thermoplasmatota archaeon]
MPLYSHSRLGTYENCPFQYKLRYVDRVKPALGNSIESFMGRMVHDALEWLYKLARDSNVVSKESLLNKYDQLWIDNWQDDIRVIKKDLTAENFKQTGGNCLEMYYDRYHPFDQAITIGLEERMMIDLPDDKKMQGYIDRLDKLGDGHLAVHDYKTSNRVPPQATADQDRQLGLYALAVQQRYPEVEKIDLVWHYVRFDEEVRSTRTQAQLDKMIDSTVSLIKDVEVATDRKDFPTKTSMLCNWCEFKSQCPEFSHQFASKKAVPTLDTTDMSATQAAETVDKLVELKAKKKDMEADMEAMVATLEAKLLAYSKESGHKTVFGKDYKASFRESEGMKIPDKKDLRRYELESSLKEMGLWDDLQEMSVYRLKTKLKSGDWTSEQRATIRKYMDTDSTMNISLKKL